ncbi:MAG: SDR family NAD(P)-dependent oxidoreductase [Gaiellaceae bacterium]
MAEVALICGASGRLGQSLVAAFLARGDDVVAVSRRSPRAAEAGVRTEIVDLRDPEPVEALWDRLDEDAVRPRWLVNAAGGFRSGPLAESDPEGLREMLAINLETAWWSCRAAARRLAPGGAIVNVASRSALLGGTSAAAYSVSKAAVVRMTEVLAAELELSRVRVNAVLPSTIADERSDPPVTSGRTVSAQEVSSVVSFLCSDAARAITGAAIPLYGWT